MSKFIKVSVLSEKYVINVDHIISITQVSDDKPLIRLTPCSQNDYGCIYPDQSYEEVIRLISE